MKWLKILIVKVAEFGNPSTKSIDRLYYVFWSILSQMRHVSCHFFLKKNCSWICMLYGEIFHASYIA